MPIDHFVVLMMENRSFDHYFGWLPNADAVQQRTYPDPDNGERAGRHTARRPRSAPPSGRAAGTRTPDTAGTTAATQLGSSRTRPEP